MSTSSISKPSKVTPLDTRVSKQSQPPESDLIQSVLAGNSEMASRVRAYDWSETPVGPPEQWPQSLRTAVSICLGSRYPTVLWWGRREYTQFYNDAYISFLGNTKHPYYLGLSGRDCWREIWPVIGPMLDSVFETGEATWSEDLLLVLDRNLPREEGYFTFSYGPIREEDGSVGGIFCSCYETTGRVVGERRLKTLRDLGQMEVKTNIEAACETVATALAENQADIPFSLLYLVEDRHARLAARTGLNAGSKASPPRISLDGSPDDERTWPLREVLNTGTAHFVGDAAERFGDLPGGIWPESSVAALVVPISSPGRSGCTGFLVSGLSPRRPVDADYRSFLDLVAGQIGVSIANAQAYETERKRAESLAELNRAKTLFFSNVSHEFRTPLTLMLGPLEDVLGKNSTRLDPEQQEHLEVARRNALRLLKLVNTLLDFSRIEAGRVHAVYEPTELASVTGEIASVFRSAMEKAGLRFSVECESIDEPVYVDRDMWEKIVLNLLSNAFKFTFEGEVALTLKAGNGSVELSVRDTGVGISPEEQGRVFERFHRIESTKARTYEGTGIGLALVQELVKLHGGAVCVESEPGVGSVFTVSIPFGAAHLPVQRIGAQRTTASTAVSIASYVDEALRWLPNASGVVEKHTAAEPDSVETCTVTTEEGKDTILIADDNADMRDYLVHLLRDQYAVHAVADGRQAVDAVRILRPSLVLTDVMMPGLDGIGVVNAIRNDESLKGTPVILLSARAGEEARVEGLQTGADDYLVKPFTARELIARVSTHVKMANLRREGAEREARLRADAECERNRLKELLAQAPAAIGLMSGPEHRWLYVNEEYLRVTGRHSASEFIGKTIRESLPEIETQPFIDLLDEVYRTGKPYFGREMKARLNRAASGQPEEGYFDFVSQPVRSTEGEVEGILVHAVEVTDKILARNAIKNTVERLQLAETAAQIGTWEWDPVRETSSLSPELHRLFGTEADDPQHKSKWESRVHPDDWMFVVEKMSDGNRSGSMEFEYRYQHPEMGLRWFYCKGARLTDETRMFGIIQDITERKQAQEALHESEQKYRDFVETASVALHWVGPDGTILWANQAELDMLGYAREEYLGHNIAEFHVDEPVISEILVRLCRGERLREHQARLRAKDGSIRHVIIDSSVLFENGKFVHTRCFTRDITERKLAEEAVIVKQQRIDADLDAMRLLHEVGMQCTRAASDFSGCLQKLVEVAVAITGADKGNLQLRERGSNVLTIAAHQGFDRPFLEFFAAVREDEASCCGRALRDGSPVIVEDVAKSEIFAGQESLDVMLAAGARAVQSMPLVSTSGKVLGMISTHFSKPHAPAERELRLIELLARQAADYIEHKQAEAALHESEERFRAIVETTPECVTLVAPNGTLLQMNSAGLEMIGADSAEMVVGKSVYDLIAPEDRERFRRFNEDICGGQSGSLEFNIIGFKGVRRHMATQAAPLRNADGSVVHLAVARDITQRKLAEQALRESEQKLRVVTDAAPVMIWMSGTDKLCFYFNKSWLDFVGHTLEQEMGNRWAENVHPDDFDRRLQIYATSFDARQPFEMEYRLRHHSGQYRWILDHGVPRFGPEGTFEGYVGGCLDIHDQKEAREKLRAVSEALRTSEERFRALVTTSSYVVYRMSPDWGQMWQLEGRGFISDTQHAIENWIDVYIHPDDQPKVLAAIRTAIETKKVFELEHRVRRVDGTLGWTASRAVPLFDNEGNIIEWFGAATDVTARREAEEAQRRLAVIVKSSDDAIISKDLNGIVTSWNPAAEKLFGYSAQEMIGRSITTIIPADLQHDEQHILATIGRGEIIDHFDTVRLTKSGERIQISVTISPIRNEAGEVVGAAKIARDITRQKKAEQALRTTEQLAAVGRLAATVAHEINNPLAAVTNLVYLSRQQAVGREIREFLTSAEEELQRIAHLTRQTLGFYRESKTPIATTLGSVVESTISVFGPRTRNKGVVIRLEIEQDPEIFAGPSELRQLVGNLLSNSIDAVESGGKIRIRISAVSKAGLFSKGVRLTIADSGSGIPEEVHAQIFEPFFTTKKDVGTGLGLWICRGIVERYSGSIRIWSSTIPGRSGTIVSVVLPISSQEQAVTDALRQAG